MITLQSYIDELQRLEREHPQKLCVITARDEDGSSFRETIHLPSVGIYKANRFSEVVTNEESPNAVCLN